MNAVSMERGQKAEDQQQTGEKGILYKYRSWASDFHRNVLFKNELYLSSPKDFNDPLDCRIIPDLTLLDTDKKKEAFADRLAIDAYDKVIAAGIDLKQVLEEFTRRIKNNLNELHQEYKELYFNTQDTHYGVLSLTFKWNSILLWSHYADYHRGFCVGLDRTKLENSALFGKGGPVVYKDEFPRIDPFDRDLAKNGFIETHTKAKDWDYEQEYRLFLSRKNGLTPEERIVKIPDDYFREIIIGLKFPKSDIPIIKQLADSKGIMLFQVIQSENSFQLERRRMI